MAVEELERIGEGLDGIVVARVLETRPIEGANKIHQVIVDAGDGEPLEIGCGAFNMAVGDLVPLATIGTVLPNGMEIGRRKMAGVWSNGMLCSTQELGLGDDHEGIYLLPAGLEVGTPFTEAMGIEADVLYDLEINPNRPDAMSVAGVARDLAARLRLPFTVPDPKPATVPAERVSAVTVEILDPDRCGRFEARVLRDVRVGPGDPKLASRLALLGMRSINNVVDVSNYVMLELGQPNHPYDLSKVAGPGFRVRVARDGEVLTTLDDIERRLTVEDLLICDGDDVPVGLGGIMGGAASEIDEATSDVLLEMAWFHPIGIVKSSRRHKLRSEASARFEKGCDPEVVDLAMRRFAELLGAPLEDGASVAIGALPERPRARCARLGWPACSAPSSPPTASPSCSIRSGSPPRRPATTWTSRSRRGATTAKPRSTSSRRSLATTGTPRSVARSRAPPTPGPCHRARPSAAASDPSWSGEASPRPCRCPSSRPESWRPVGCPTTASRSPTRWWPSSRCCAPRCCPDWWARSPTTGRTATTASASSRSATRSTVRHRPMPSSPMSASASARSSRAAEAPEAVHLWQFVVRGAGRTGCSSSRTARCPGSTRPARRGSSWAPFEVGAVGEIDPGRAGSPWHR